MSRPDAIIVGGGIIGCLIARLLAMQGKSVTIIERGALGREASHDAAGMLAPQSEADKPGPFLDLCLESRSLFPELADDLFRESGVDVRYRDDGTFLLAFDTDEAERLAALAALHTSWGLQAEVLAPAVARQFEPAVAPNVVSVVSIPGDHQIDNRRFVEAAIVSCHALGVKILDHTPVRALLRDANDRVCGVDTTDGIVESETVIVAAGCWSNFVAGFPVPVEPVKGQMLMLELAVPIGRRVLRSERCYVVSRVDGRVIIGATMERVGFDKSVSAAAVGLLLESAREIAPSLASALGGEAWAGLRPTTPDGIPAIGYVEDGLVSAVGHFRNGILLAPITAALVADVVLGNATHKALGFVDPKRFASNR